MKQAILFAVFFTVAQLSFAGNPVCEDQPVKNPNDSVSASLPAMSAMLSDIMGVTGLQSTIELKQAEVMNIEASISHRKRYILYNPSFIKWINDLTKDKWAAMALLAHEVGHHLNGHTILKCGSTVELELEADQFAGFILNKLGASLEQAQEVMKYISKKDATKTHPARNSRLLAIATGWNKAADEAILTAHVSSSPKSVGTP